MSAPVQWEVIDAEGLTHAVHVDAVTLPERVGDAAATHYVATLGGRCCGMQSERLAVVGVALAAGVEVSVVQRQRDAQFDEAVDCVLDTMEAMDCSILAMRVVARRHLDEGLVTALKWEAEETGKHGEDDATPDASSLLLCKHLDDLAAGRSDRIIASDEAWDARACVDCGHAAFDAASAAAMCAGCASTAVQS